jgi:hypothetical protein
MRAKRREVIFITSIIASVPSPEGLVLLPSRSNRELRPFPMLAQVFWLFSAPLMQILVPHWNGISAGKISTA